MAEFRHLRAIFNSGWRVRKSGRAGRDAAMGALFGDHFVGLFEARPPDMPSAACFPGGHSSAGYAWVALYFFAWVVRPQLRGRLLATALLAGAIFGAGQQLRGAHFLSHDLWSLGISWLVAATLFLVMFPRLAAGAVPVAVQAPTAGARA